MSCINVFEQPFWNDLSLPALEPLLLVEVVMILSNNISMISTELTIIDPVTACTIAPGKLVTLWKTLCQDVRRLLAPVCISVMLVTCCCAVVCLIQHITMFFVLHTLDHWLHVKTTCRGILDSMKHSGMLLRYITHSEKNCIHGIVGFLSLQTIGVDHSIRVGGQVWLSISSPVSVENLVLPFIC